MTEALDAPGLLARDTLARVAMTSEPTAIASAVAAICRTAARYDIDGRALARDIGIADEVFESPGARVRSSLVDALMAQCAEASKDPAFGLRMAEESMSISFHLYFAMASSPTLGGATQRLVRYQHLVSELLQVDVKEEGSLVSIHFRCPEPTVGPWYPADAMGASFVLGARGLAMDPAIAPARVDLRRPEPRDRTHFDSLFACPMFFGRPHNVIFYDDALLNRSLPLANPDMLAQADGVVARYISGLDDTSIARRVRKVVALGLPEGMMTREDVAERLGMSARHLARLLADEGTTFRELQAQVQRRLAEDYLAAGDANITEIAFMLGFSETSAFSRAFRRWTGLSPKAFVQAK